MSDFVSISSAKRDNKNNTKQRQQINAQLQTRQRWVSWFVCVLIISTNHMKTRCLLSFQCSFACFFFFFSSISISKNTIPNWQRNNKYFKYTFTQWRKNTATILAHRCTSSLDSFQPELISFGNLGCLKKFKQCTQCLYILDTLTQRIRSTHTHASNMYACVTARFLLSLSVVVFVLLSFFSQRCRSCW